MNFKLVLAAVLCATMLMEPAAAATRYVTVVTFKKVRKPCTVQISYEERSAVWRDNVQKLHGVTLETFWGLAKTDPKAAAKMIVGGKKGGVRGMDGVVRPAGPAMLDGLPPPEGPFALVKFTYEGLGKEARGVWTSADGGTLQTIDFRFTGWRGSWEIHRIAISAPDRAVLTPDKMCDMSKEAPALW